MLFSKTARLLTTPGMPVHWLRWQLRHLGRIPEIQLPSGARLRGFDTFSEFWGGKTLIPPPAEARFVKHSVDQPGAVIDVGANVGFFALLVSRWAQTREIHAFEPSPKNYRKLCENVELNVAQGCVHTHPLALSDHEGLLSFLADERNPTRNRAIVAPNPELEGSTTVNATTLDQFAFDQQIGEIALLKIDVEGYEPNVLRGAAKLLKEKRCRAGLIELCPANLRQCHTSVEELLELVGQLGYELRYLSEDGLPGEEVTLENVAPVVLDNVALLPKA